MIANIPVFIRSITHNIKSGIDLLKPGLYQKSQNTMSNSFCDQPVSVKPIDRTEVLGPINIFIKATTQSHEILARTMSSTAYLLLLTFKRTLVAIFLMFFSCFEGHSVNIFFLHISKPPIMCICALFFNLAGIL